MDGRYLNIAQALARRLQRLWGLHVHVFLEDGGSATHDDDGACGVFLHRNVLKGKRPSHLPETGSWPAIVYDRIFAPALLPGYQRLIYLDADVFPLTVAEEVLSLPLPYGLGAVQDTATIGFAPHTAGLSRDRWRESIGLTAQRYFNSGALIIERNRWMDVDFGAELRRYMKSHADAVRMPDQDFLNWLFQDRWTELSPRFNFQKALFNYGCESVFPPVFLHFSSFQKPWLGTYVADSVQGQFGHLYQEMLRDAGIDPAACYGRRDESLARRWRKLLRRWLSESGLRTGKEHRQWREWNERSTRLWEGFREDQEADRYADLRFVVGQAPRPELVFDGQYLCRRLDIPW